MDPLTVFPPEIIHQIWRHLKPADLLTVRAVAPHWLASVSDCSDAWVTDFSHDWTEFLAVKKTVRSWSSKKISRQTVRNVRDCLLTEFAYYLLYSNGTLQMFSPRGDPVRIFNRQVSDLHRGEKCLLIGMDETHEASKNSGTRHRTVITDFVLNYLDDMFDTETIASSPNGYSYKQNGEFFFSLGPDIPGALKIPYSSDAQLHFLASSVISVEGFTDKTVQFFDAETRSFAHLKTYTSSPRWIPSVEILPGPEDYFSVIVKQRDFTTISVYHRNTPLSTDSYPSSFKCTFTEDYFVLSLKGNTVTAFKLTNFTKHYELNIPAHYNMKSISYESWSLLKNTFAVLEVNLSRSILDSPRWLFYKLSEMRRESATQIASSITSEDDTKLEPKLQLLAANSACKLSGDELFCIGLGFCPSYAFKILSRSGEKDRVLDLLHFDLGDLKAKRKTANKMKV